MVKLVCIVEVAEAQTVDEAEQELDNFRESTWPSANYGLMIYRATEREADAAVYADAADIDLVGGLNSAEES